MIDPLDNLEAVANDPASTTGQIVDALALCATETDFPHDWFTLRLSPTGWPANLRKQALRAVHEYETIHQACVAKRRAERIRRDRFAATVAHLRGIGVDERDVNAVAHNVDSLVQTHARYAVDKIDTKAPNRNVWGHNEHAMTVAAVRRLRDAGIITIDGYNVRFSDTVIAGLVALGLATVPA